MKLSHFHTILTGTLALAFSHWAEAGFVALDPIESGSNTALAALATVGWSFTPTVDITVTDLGYYDFGGNGLAESHRVGIWADGGSLLGEATVGTGDPILDGFRYTAAPLLSLVSGQKYVIAGFQSDAADRVLTVPAGAISFSTDLAILFGEARATFAPVFARPDGTEAGITDGFFGPNFQFEPTAVPEPGTALLCLAGVGATLLRRRR